nr:FecR family protein [uncultured Chitinophaga sp.]
MSEFINRIAELISGHLGGTLTKEEENELRSWVSGSEKARTFFEQVNDKTHLSHQLEQLYAYDHEAAWEKLKESYPLKAAPAVPLTPILIRKWLKPAAAAAILLGLAGSVFFWSSRKTSVRPPVTIAKNIEVTPPGKSLARIILPGGETIYLDSLSQHAAIRQSGADLVKLADDAVAYSSAGAGPSSANAYNTLLNPRGSKVIHLTLSDGTKVWLNNESSLYFPVQFSGSERIVEVTGEAYFEVAQLAAKPFRVKHADWEVLVLGTHFNINSYQEASTAKVTLLEGMVKVSRKEDAHIIRPGQQARISGAITVQKAVDTETVMAWRNGQFVLDGMDVKGLMQQVARWYDVEVVYTGTIEKRTFGGSLDRSLALSRVVRALQENGVPCRLEGRRLIVGN